MSRIVDLLKREPVRAYLYSVLCAAIGLLAAFGVVLTAGQVAAVIAFLAVVLHVGEKVRASVTSPATREAEEFFKGRESNVTY